MAMSPAMLDVEPLGQGDGNIPGAEEPPTDSNEQTKSPEDVGYTSSAERCHSCKNFDAEGMNCNKFGFPAEPDGHCPEGFEAAGGDAEESAEGADVEALEDVEPMGD